MCADMLSATSDNYLMVHVNLNYMSVRLYFRHTWFDKK